MPAVEEESIASEVLSASLGGAISASILYPLDVLKTQMQAGCGANSAGEGGKDPKDEVSDESKNNGSMVAVARRLYDRDPTVFVRGMETSAFQSALEKALYFLAYATLKRSYLSITNQTHLSTLPNLVLGCAAEWAHLPVSLPVDAWTTRVQTSKTNQAPLQILLHMLRDPTCRFYSGLSAYTLLCLKPALQYTVYEQVKAAVLRTRPRGSTLSAVEAFALGMIARTVSTVLVFPFLRAKVLLQTSKTTKTTKTTTTTTTTISAPRGEATQSPPTPPPPPPSPVQQQTRVLDVVRDLWRRDGLSGLYQGLTPELTRGVFSAAFMLMIKEKLAIAVQRLLEQRRQHHHHQQARHSRLPMNAR